MEIEVFLTDKDMIELWTALMAVRACHLMNGQSPVGYEMMWKGEKRLAEAPAENPFAACLGWIMEAMQNGADISELAETCIYFRGLDPSHSAWKLTVSVSERKVNATQIEVEEWEEESKVIA